MHSETNNRLKDGISRRTDFSEPHLGVPPTKTVDIPFLKCERKK
jgi:hypothetical protein